MPPRLHEEPTTAGNLTQPTCLPSTSARSLILDFNAGSLVQALQHAAQIPDYHPAALQINILGNRRMGAVASVQHLLASLQPPPSPESSPDGPQKHVASKTPPQPLRMSVDAQPSRRPSQNGAQALTSPAAAYANGQRLAVDPSSPATAGMYPTKAADALDSGLLAWAEEIGCGSANGAAVRIVAWDEVGTETSTAKSQPLASRGLEQLSGLPRALHETSTPRSSSNKSAAVGPKIEKTGKPSADPGAFDPGAFGMGSFGDPDESEDQASSQTAQPASDPGAFDPDAFGFGMSGDPAEIEEKPAVSKPAAPAADPGAFDPGAFGFGVPEDPAEDQEHPTITKAGTPAADPGAFDPGAFGFGMSADPAEDEEKPAVSKPMKPAADPGAFDPGAFGFGMSEAPAEDKEQPAASRHVKPAVDPEAFDAGAFGCKFSLGAMSKQLLAMPSPADQIPMSAAIMFSAFLSFASRVDDGVAWVEIDRLRMGCQSKNQYCALQCMSLARPGSVTASLSGNHSTDDHSDCFAVGDEEAVRNRQTSSQHASTSGRSSAAAAGSSNSFAASWQAVSQVAYITQMACRKKW